MAPPVRVVRILHRRRTPRPARWRPAAPRRCTAATHRRRSTRGRARRPRRGGRRAVRRAATRGRSPCGRRAASHAARCRRRERRRRGSGGAGDAVEPQVLRDQRLRVARRTTGRARRGSRGAGTRTLRDPIGAGVCANLRDVLVGPALHHADRRQRARPPRRTRAPECTATALTRSRIAHAHDRGQRAARRHARDQDPLAVDPVDAAHAADLRGDDRGLALAVHRALLEPVPAAPRVGGVLLPRQQHHASGRGRPGRRRACPARIPRASAGSRGTARAAARASSASGPSARRRGSRGSARRSARSRPIRGTRTSSRTRSGRARARGGTSGRCSAFVRDQRLPIIG